MVSTLNLRAAIVGVVATLVLVAAILLGSRNLAYFDPALVAYLFGCVVACLGAVYRTLDEQGVVISEVSGALCDSSSTIGR